MLYLFAFLILAVVIAAALWARNEFKKDTEAASHPISFDPPPAQHVVIAASLPVPPRVMSRPAPGPAAGTPFQPRASSLPVRPHVPGTVKYGSPRAHHPFTTPSRQDDRPNKPYSNDSSAYVPTPVLYSDPGPSASPEPSYHGGGGHFGGGGASGGYDSPSHDSGSSSGSGHSSSGSDSGGGSQNSCSSPSSCGGGGGGGGGD